MECILKNIWGWNKQCKEFDSIGGQRILQQWGQLMWKACMDMRALSLQDLKIFSINREAICISYWCFSTTQREEPFIVIPARMLTWGRGRCGCSSLSQHFFQCLPIIIIKFLIPLKFFLIMFPSSSFLIIFFRISLANFLSLLLASLLFLFLCHELSSLSSVLGFLAIAFFHSWLFCKLSLLRNRPFFSKFIFLSNSSLQYYILSIFFLQY